MSEQSIRVASWNLCDGLSGATAADAKTMHAVVEQIKAVEADVVVLPEAFNEAVHFGTNEKMTEVFGEATDELTAAGYQIHTKLYNDTDGRKDRHGFALLTRLDAGQNPVEVVDLGSRNSLRQYVSDISLTIAGVHFDDRYEKTRITQAAALLGGLDAEQPNVILGDFNAMNRGDKRAVALRVVRPLVRVLPTVDPGETSPNLAKLRRVGSLGSRLTDMANGSTMGFLWANGYLDLDSAQQPTKGPVQLDHVVSNIDAIGANSWMSVGDFQVHETNGQSDHRPISAIVRY